MKTNKKQTGTADKLYFSNLTIKSYVCLLITTIISIVLLCIYIPPFKAERHFRDGFNLGANKRYQYAIQELEKAKYYAPWESHYQVQLAKYYEEYSQQQTANAAKVELLKKAKAIYLNIIKLDKQNPWYRNRLAQTYQLLANADPANASFYKEKVEENIRLGAELDKQNPLFQLNYASYLHKNGQFDEAKKYYQKVIEYDDSFGEAFYNLADIYRQENNLEKTLYYYEALYESNPDFGKISLALASTYIMLDQKDKAIFHLEREINKDPKQFDPLRSLAALYHQKSEWIKSASAYKLILTYFPEKKEVHPYYIQSLINAGRFQLAIQELETFIQANPSNEQAKLQLKKINDFIKKAIKENQQ